jgi:predicted nucleotidyltransferase
LLRNETLEKVKNSEIARYKKKKDVLGIAVAGSLGRGDTWECSDVDLVVLVDKAKSDFYLDFNDKPKIPVDIAVITPKLLEQPFVDSLYGSKVVYDPTNLLAKAIEKTNRNYFSDNEVSKRNKIHFEKAEDLLNKAYDSLEEKDFVSAIGHSRLAVLNTGATKAEESHIPPSHHLRISKNLLAFERCGVPYMKKSFLEALRLDKVDEGMSNKYDGLVRKLFVNTYPWAHEKLKEGKAPQWLDWVEKIPLQSLFEKRMSPVYKVGKRHVDFVDKVIDEYEELVPVIFEVNDQRHDETTRFGVSGQKYDEVTTVFRDLKKLKDQPSQFPSLYRKALNASNLTYGSTQRIVDKSSNFCKSVLV